MTTDTELQPQDPDNLPDSDAPEIEETRPKTPLSAAQMASCLLTGVGLGLFLYWFPFKAVMESTILLAAYDLRLTASLGVCLFVTSLCLVGKSQAPRDTRISEILGFLGALTMVVWALSGFIKQSNPHVTPYEYQGFLTTAPDGFYVYRSSPDFMEDAIKTGRGELWAKQEVCLDLVSLSKGGSAYYTMSVNGLAPSPEACGTRLNVLSWEVIPNAVQKPKDPKDT